MDTNYGRTAPTSGEPWNGRWENLPFLDRKPVFVGDDRTDEEGFVAALAPGGCAIHVGPLAETIAEIFVAKPEATRHWLGAVATALSRH